MQTEMRSIYKYVLLLAAAFAAGQGIHAQTMTAEELYPEDAHRRRTRLRTEWNLYAGATYAGWSSDREAMSFDPKVGYHVGFDMGLLFGHRCALVPELRFTHTAVNITGTAGYVARIKSNGIDFPLMFEYRILRGRLRFQAGPSFTLLDSNNCSYRGDEMNGLRLRPTVTYVVGMRGIIGRRVSVGARFNGQFNRTEQVMGWRAGDSDHETYRLGSYRLSVSIGYRF